MIEILSILIAAVISVLLFSRIGFGAVLGYLVAGVIIGPSVLELVTDPENIRHVGEFGVVFLLFMIGIEIKPQRLWLMRRAVFGLGGAQVLITGILITLVAFYAFGQPSSTAIIVGFGLALSSTAFAVQAMAEKNQLNTNWGRNSFAILLLQDLAVVPLLVLVPLLAAGSINLTASMGLAVLESAAIFVGVLLVGHYAITPALRLIASSKSSEVFTATALLLVLGFAWVMELAGLSMAMGAFVAGILLSESEFRHQIEADIDPFRGLLLGLFFMSVGMSVDLSVVFKNISLVFVGTIALLTFKTLIIFIITKIGKLNTGEAVRSAFLLSQAGEFGFVLFSLADLHQILPDGFSEPLISIIVLSMALTPGMIFLGETIAKRLSDKQTVAHTGIGDVKEDVVLIAGYGRVGQTVGKMLDLLGQKWVAVDLNVDKITNGRAKGHKIYYGDISQEKVLHALSSIQTKLIILTVDGIRATEKTIRAIKHLHPDMPIVVRAHDLKIGAKLETMGAIQVVPEVVETSFRLGASAIQLMGYDEHEIRQTIDNMRDDNYAAVWDVTESSTSSK